MARRIGETAVIAANLCLTRSTRLSKCLSSASAGTRMNTGCLGCLGTFRFLPVRGLYVPVAAALHSPSLWFLFKVKKKERQERHTPGARTNTGFEAASQLFNFPRHPRQLLRQEGGAPCRHR